MELIAGPGIIDGGYFGVVLKKVVNIEGASWKIDWTKEIDDAEDKMK